MRFSGAIPEEAWRRGFGAVSWLMRKKSQTRRVGDSAIIKRLADYFVWRQPYRGDETRVIEDVTWALRQTREDPEHLAVYILETVNERNSLLKRIRAVSAIATNQDFVEDATVESVEWAFGQKLKDKKVR